ncbi:MAG: phosphatase PAP2 family protein [Ignavibacteriota bacterium]
MFLKSNKNLITIFVSSFIIFLLSCFGLFDGLSALVSKSLYNTLGYTNKWSTTYGESWFVNMSSNISAFGSREVVLIFSIFFLFYLFKARDKTKALDFLLTVTGGIILIVVLKSFTSTNEIISFKTFLTESLSNFPSGHTFIATILYLGTASALKSYRRSSEVNVYFFIAASVLIFIVGMSRVTGGAHTVTEVIAGWSLGLCWFTFAQMFLRLNHKTVFNK